VVKSWFCFLKTYSLVGESLFLLRNLQPIFSLVKSSFWWLKIIQIPSFFAKSSKSCGATGFISQLQRFHCGAPKRRSSNDSSSVLDVHSFPSWHSKGENCSTLSRRKHPTLQLACTMSSYYWRINWHPIWKCLMDKVAGGNMYSFFFSLLWRFHVDSECTVVPHSELMRIRYLTYGNDDRSMASEPVEYLRMATVIPKMASLLIAHDQRKGFQMFSTLLNCGCNRTTFKHIKLFAW
jgi:hypothetical protein